MNQRLMALYNALFDLYGPQHWWPAESPWEVCIGAILTQNTNWNNVEKAISNLKIAGLIGKGEGRTSSEVLKCGSSKVENWLFKTDNAFKLLECRHDKIAELIRPSGYFNIKTARLLSVAQWWVDNVKNGTPGNRNIDINDLRHSLLKVHGIGPETADTVILYAFNLPSFVVDAYTKRICSVCFKTPIHIDYNKLRSIFMDNLPHDVSLFNEYHALIVRLGKEKDYQTILAELPSLLTNC